MDKNNTLQISLLNLFESDPMHVLSPNLSFWKMAASIDRLAIDKHNYKTA